MPRPREIDVPVRGVKIPQHQHGLPDQPPHRDSPRALLALADEPMDRALEHSVTFALMEIGQPDAVPLSRLARRPGALRVALMALDQMDGDNLSAADVLPSLKSKSAALRKTAEWICDRHAEWGNELAAHYAAELRRVRTPAIGARILV